MTTPNNTGAVAALRALGHFPIPDGRCTAKVKPAPPSNRPPGPGNPPIWCSLPLGHEGPHRHSGGGAYPSVPFRASDEVEHREPFEVCNKCRLRWPCEDAQKVFAATPPEDAPAVDGGDAVRLYHAVNRMMAALGAEGEVSTRHRTVQQVMDELARIDGGAYDETLAAAPAPAVDGGDAWTVASLRGFERAFWELAEIMQIGAQPLTPKQVWETQMRPTLQRMFAAAPAPAAGTNPHIGSSFDDFMREQGLVPATPPTREDTAAPQGDAGTVREDETLWALHIEGPDDVHPAPSREMAQEAADLFNATFPQPTDPNRPRAVAKVIEWPHGARSHALSASAFVANWLTPTTIRGSAAMQSPTGEPT